MTHPAVSYVLDAVAQSWPTGIYADLPALRIDRDNSLVFDGDGAIDLSTATRDNEEQLKRGLLISAAFVDEAGEYIGTEADLDREAVVSLRAEGLSARKHGYVDPQAGYPPASDGDAVPWYEFTEDLKDAIYVGREFPDTGEANVSYTHLGLQNTVRDASAYGDYYRFETDVVFDGFETLP